MKYGYLLFVVSLLVATVFVIDYTRYTRISAFENQRPSIVFPQRAKATNRATPNPTFGPPRQTTKPSISYIPPSLVKTTSSGKIHPGESRLILSSTPPVKGMPVANPATTLHPVPPKKEKKIHPGAGHRQHATHRPDILTHL